MNNDNNSDKLKLWVGIFLIALIASPFIIKAVISKNKDDVTLSEIYKYHRH